MTGSPPRVAILLSTFNGARYLPAQLDSFERQTEPGWHVLWRDDGSTDDTVAIMRRFATDHPVTPIDTPGRLGPAGSFYTLLAAAQPLGTPVAFSDQDDVWLPDKLARALAALAAGPGPAVYFSRQNLVDGALAPIGSSAPFHRPPSFHAALIGNIATGCTLALDPAAVALVAASPKPHGPLHDWWSYLLVAAVGGRVIADPEPTLLYRQHAANQVGAPRTRLRRALGALRRGPDLYLSMLQANVDALRTIDALTPSARHSVATIDRALHGGLGARLRALALPGLHRQTPLETALFRLWLMRGPATRADAAQPAYDPAASPPR